MLHLYFAAFFIYLFTGNSVVCEGFTLSENSSQKLEWPCTYNFKATKYSLTSNLVQEFQAWVTNDAVRIDYNNGAVKSIAYYNKDDKKQQYEIHPETKDGETPEIVCNVLNVRADDFDLGSGNLLPSLSPCDVDYKFVGFETINGRETNKYESIKRASTSDVRNTLWVSYYATYNIWIPVRHEIKEYNTDLGSLKYHDLTEFTDFHFKFDEDVFYIGDNICNANNTVIHHNDSEKVTRELMFINPHNKNHVEHVYNSFVKNFARIYANEKEHALRKAIFERNMRMVSMVNKKKLSYTLAINHFSDRTPEEIEMSMGLRRQVLETPDNIPFPYDEETTHSEAKKLPSFYDARLFGLVGTVKDQGNCGSCWAFGSTAAMEGALARANGGRLITLSSQALVDCAWKKNEGIGCNGGQNFCAFKWIKEYGLPTEEDYGPYKAKEDYCHIKNVTRRYYIRGYTNVRPFCNDATKLSVVKHGPLSTLIRVTDQFRHYSRGIFYEYECDSDLKNLNHIVALVGYGESNGELFWIIKNSWGPTWGMAGYMHISAKDNTCGTTTEPSYVVLK